jgi:hypothetical protein
LGRAFELCPLFRAAAVAGEVGVGQMHALAAVVTNPRVGQHLDGSEALLVGYACTLAFDDFITVLAGWEQAADPDGADQAHDRAHRERRASVSLVGARMFLDAVGGLAAGVQLEEILDRYTQLEWDDEWAAGVAEHGDRMHKTLMVRTPAQRRFDALLRAMRVAAGWDDTEITPVTVNIVVDQQTFEQQLATAAGASPAPLDPADTARRCGTGRGVVLHPADVLAAAWVGHVRRIVLGADGVVLDMGTRTRLFTGAVREAVMLSGARCVWPGCDRPVTHCQADHSTPHGREGPTATWNGAPMCGHHNRWKTRGFQTTRQPDGQWTILRVNGSQIGWQAHLEQLLQQHLQHGA